MDLFTPSRSLDKSPFKDITNSTPTPLVTAGSGRKNTKSASKGKRSNPGSASVQRRSTRLNALKEEHHDQNEIENEVEVHSERKTRSGRKITPAIEGSVVTRRQKAKKGTEEGGVSSARSRRRSVSTLPSSPLAGKNAQQTPMKFPHGPIGTDSEDPMPIITEADSSQGNYFYGFN